MEKSRRGGAWAGRHLTGSAIKAIAKEHSLSAREVIDMLYKDYQKKEVYLM